MRSRSTCIDAAIGGVRYPLVLALALLLWPVLTGTARAGDVEDCSGPPSGKAEAACSDIINDAARSTEDRTKAFAGRARFHIARGKIDQAFSDADAAVQLNGQFVPALIARGYVQQRKGRLDPARADFDRAIELEPNNPFGFLARGNLRADQHAWADAISDYGQAITLRQDLPAARVGRARAYLGLKKPDDAMKDLDFVLAARPDDQPALTLRGITWSALRNYDKAIDDLDRAIAQRETVEGLFARAKAHEALNHADKATEDFRKATQLAPSSVFDVLAQAESKRKVQELTKKVPCGTGQGGTCL